MAGQMNRARVHQALRGALELKVRSLGVAAVLGMMVGSAEADYVQLFWTNGTGNGSWTVPGNWADGGIWGYPNNGVDEFNAVITGGGQVVSLVADVVVSSAGVESSNELQINNAGSLGIVGGDIGDPLYGKMGIDGLLTMNSTGSATDLYVIGGTNYMLIGSDPPGTLRMGPNLNNRIYASGVGTIRIDGSVRVEGAGQIGINTTEIHNIGQIMATEPSVDLILDPRDAAPVINEGQIGAELGGVLQMNAGTYQNIGPDGRLTVGPGSRVDLNGCTLLDSTLECFGDGYFNVIGNTVSLERCTLLGDLDVPNSLDPRFEDSFTLVGLMSLQSTGGATYMYVDNENTGGLTIDGGGVIDMSNSPNNGLRAWNGGEHLVLEDVAIRGAGSIGFNDMSIHLMPSSQITANVSNTLTLDPNGGGMLVESTIQATNGGTLRFQAGVYDLTGGGSIFAGLDSFVELNGCDLVGGTLQSQLLEGVEPGLFTVIGNTVTFRDVSLNGTIIDVPNSIDPRFQDSITNAGTINLLSSGGATYFYVDNVNTGGVTLDGGGVVSMSDSINNGFRAWNGGEVLTNVDNTIRGAGQIGFNDMGISNLADGLILADLTARLDIDPSGLGCVNEGVMRADNGGTLRLGPGVFDNTLGVIEALNGSTLELYSADVANWGNTINVLDGSVCNFNGAWAVRGGAINADPDTYFTVTASVGVLESVSFNGYIDCLNAADFALIDDIINSGEIHLDSTGGATTLYIDNNATTGATLSGGGVVSMSDNPSNQIRAWNGNESFTNMDNTIRGSGGVGHNSISITNHGTFIADQANMLNVDPNGTTAINDGEMRAETGGTLRLSAATWDNTGGLVQAGPGSLVELSGVTLNGGVVESTGDGVVRVISNTTSLQNLTVNGTMDVPNSIDPQLVDGIVNTGDINLNSTGSATFLYIDNIATGGVQLSGGGSVNMTDNVNNGVRAWNGNEVFANIDNTIQGAGRIGFNDMQIINDGTIIANSANVMQIDANGSGFTNGGTLIAESGSTMLMTDDFVQDGGQTSARGLVDLGGTRTMELQGGDVNGDGTINGHLVQSGGSISPGESAGDLTVTGDFEMSGCSTLNIELGGLKPGAQYDVLDVGGDAVINGGTITVSYIDGFTPSFNDTFVILTSASLTGAFVDVTGPGTYQIVHTPDAVQLVVLDAGGPSCPGDFDGSGDVGTTDLLALLSAWGGCSTTHDLDNDGAVGIGDLLILLASWGPCP